MSDLVIDPMTAADWEAVRAIYSQGIESGDATFETTVPTWDAWDEAHVPACRLVARLDCAVVGWAALTPSSPRSVYHGVADVSVYVDDGSRRAGTGRALLQQLVEDSEREGFWTLQAGIFPENTASLALHRACGFRSIGTRERLGRCRDGRWRDVILMERRSPVAGGA